jgi:hypothetical protein
MKSITDHIRTHLLQGVQEQDRTLHTLAFKRVQELFESQKFKWILNHAKFRILMGTFRYEQGGNHIRGSKRGEFYYLDKLNQKIKLYRETGNQEWLIDAFNYIILELTHPHHTNAHFESNERQEHETR